MSDHDPYTWHFENRPPAETKEPKPRPSVAGLALVAVFSAALSSGLTIALTEPILVPAPSANERPALKISEERLEGAPNLPRVLDSVFTIAVRGTVSGGSGSGVAIEPNHIVTNAHVVTVGGAVLPEDAVVEVQDSMGVEYDAKIVGVDYFADIAVLSVPGLEATPVPWGESEDLTIGETVIAVGAPLGLSNTVTSGIVSSLNRPVNLAGEGDTDATVINAVQTDAAINSGNSGGPLVNAMGELIGINVAISTGPAGNGNIGIGYAIPGDYAKRVVEEIIADGEASHGRLGIEVSTRGSAGGAFEDGARVESVEVGSVADKAGLKTGDVFISWDGKAVSSSGALIGFVKSETPGTTVLAEIERAGKIRAIEVTVGSLS